MRPAADERGASDSKNLSPAPVLMAQNQTTAILPQSSQADSTNDPSEEVSPPLEEIIVTGTNIRGVDTSASPVFVFSREEIELTSRSTIAEVVETLPQTFGGAPRATTTAIPGIGNGANNNGERGSGINLRGLGADSTLTLLNGRRVAPSGIGNYVDLSVIPMVAVDRIEVLADGASAIYGSDAVGGVVNVILRKRFDGAQTRARFGSAENSSSDEIQFSHGQGFDWGSVKPSEKVTCGQLTS